jgi:Sigma-70, region 4
MNFPGVEPDEVPADSSCALDVADRGITLEEIGGILHVSREAVRQIEKRALANCGSGALEPYRDHESSTRTIGQLVEDEGPGGDE